MLNSLLTAKAPLVALPIEGHRPLILDRRKLAAWAKGVTITAAQVRWSFTEIAVPAGAEGPCNLVAVPAGLSIKGRAGRASTSATLYPVPRAQAVATLNKWAEKEREKIPQRGVLSPEMRKALKLAALGDGLPVTIDFCQYFGAPYTIPEMAGLRFALVKLRDGFTVTEIVTGLSAGKGATAEAAILDVTRGVAKLSLEKIAEIHMKVWAAQKRLTTNY